MLGIFKLFLLRVNRLILVIRLKLRYSVGSITGVDTILPILTPGALHYTLVKFGAKIDKTTTILSGLIIDNAITNDYSNLKIGEHTYIGRGCFFDLVEPIIIKDNVAVSAKCMFLTHADPGERPLMEYFPRKTGKIIIENGCWLGAGAIVLPGVTVGECSVIGAGAVVTEDIPPYTVASGVPAKIVRRLKNN